MHRQFRAVARLAVATVITAGCTQTVGGSAAREQPSVPGRDGSYGYVDDRCGLLVDSTVQEILGADHARRPYSGAVCQYVLSRNPPASPNASQTMVDVTFSWFESGNLDRERTLARERGAAVTDGVVERRPAFFARRDVTGAACAATAAAGSGVLSWWVQLRGPFGGHRTDDPCQDAGKLLSATLQSEL